MADQKTPSLPVSCNDCAKPMDSPICCTSCGALNISTIGVFNYFELFGVARSFDLNEQALHHKYLSLNRFIHPDRVAGQSEEVRQRSLTLSAELNRAYDTLRDPVARAEYLLSLAGGPSAAEDKTVPGDLLGEIMVLREEIEEAKEAGKTKTLQSIGEQIVSNQQGSLEIITTLVRSMDIGEAKDLKQLRQQLNTTKYWNNLLEQLPMTDPA